MFHQNREQALHRHSGTERQAMDRRGFTLVELMITLTVLAVVMVVLMSVMYAAQRSKNATANSVESAQAARVALDMLSRDLRSAGYGTDVYFAASPQPPIAYIDSLQVLINANFQPWPEPDTIPRAPLAYNPVGAPRPYPLNGTPWQPPIKYRRGAETIRWTLDVDNNGAVNAADISNFNGLDAQRTPNPNDYVLVRQVYGDSTGNVVNNNGGQMERIALVRKPGGGVPAMFRVYLQGKPTFWDWSSGPLPPGELANIQRIEVTVVAPSGRPNSKGEFAETRLTTEVNSIRNVPNAGRKEYTVDGYVFEDLDQSFAKDPLEPGLSGTVVRLGQYSSTTNSAGYFIFRVPAGSYVIKHQPPPGYGIWTQPDSASITVGPAATFSFADTARAGGWVTTFTYHDEYADGTFDGSDAPLSGVELTLNPTGQKVYSDAAGKATLFAPVGGYSISATPPDSFVATTPNPVSGSMADGGTASHEFGLSKTEVGTVRGRVFRDNNRDGDWDSGEAGIPNVWVGVTSDNGVTILSYKYTDASGNYDLTVPSNDPPHTTPYKILAIVPPGYYATSTTAIGPLWLTPNAVVPNKDFGMLGYTIITLNASRVLSLASGDLVEKIGNDNGGNQARRDADIVLGADAGGTDNVSVWYNDYDTTPVFAANASYTRNAPQSVLSLSIDTLDTASPKTRLDLVTGTKNATGGNFFVWFNQNSGGNEGYYPLAFDRAYRTTDNGDVQSVLTADVAGGSSADQVDIIVGTRSSTSGQGSIEIWASNNAATPSFSRLETYPTAGAMSLLGEVNCMALADFDNDGRKDLVVGTRTADFTGQLLFLRNNGKSSGSSRFTLAAAYDPGGIVTALTPVKVDADSLTDVIVGIQTGLSTGYLEQWTNASAFGVISFVHARTISAPGIVMSLVSADFGGLATHTDFAMGWRQTSTSYVGGVLIYPLDIGLLISNGIDPSAGSVTNMTPAMTVNNFNYGVNPVTPSPPYLTDLAAGIKVSATTGALVVFIR